MEINIIFEDKSLLVCEKPSGMLSLSAESDEDSLLDILSRTTDIGGKKRTLYPVHRLDRTTAGLIVFAKNKRAAAMLSAIFAEHKNEKEYLCVVHGIPKEPKGELCNLLFADKRANKAYITDKQRKGVKEARLSYELVASAIHKDKDISLLRVSLHTGRMHQIRAQLSHAGHPLLGDGKYGSRENSCTTALFSSRLKFSFDGEREFSAEPPRQFPWNIFDT